ncbi:hypothetical protein JCM10450v2_001070 [Rhodotorula kratochvilovae]
MLRSAALISRTLAPARTLARPHALPLALVAPSASPSFVAPAALGARLASSHAPAESTNLRASAGSGQGGKEEKEAARREKERAKQERAHARKERERERAHREKERERARKEKEKAKHDKERAKAQREKEREKARKDKEKERVKAAADKLKERRLKLKEKEASKKPRTVLHPPKAPQNSWAIFLTDFVAEKKRTLAEGEKLATVAVLVKEATPLYQSLSAEEKAALQARSEEQRKAYPAILDAWKKTLTPEMIHEENLVRARKRRLGLSHKANLRIEGEPKRPSTPYLHFSHEVRARGVDSDVLKGETNILAQSKLLAQAWRELPEEQKKKYQDAYLADKERYQREKAAFDAEQAQKKESSS